MGNNLQVLYEDTNVVAITKPSGMLTPTAEEWFKEKYPNGIGYVHRLDRDTSGVLVFAKNQIAYDFLRKAFHDHDVKKTYLAFVYGVLPARGGSSSGGKRGVIDFDIGRSRKDFRLRSAQPKAKGHLRASVTRYEVLAEAPEFSLLKMSPETGRTHQIRVHLKAINHPILNDPLYAPNRPAGLGISRLGLHAYQLDIPLPSGGRTDITAPIPTDLAPALTYFPDVKEKFALT